MKNLRSLRWIVLILGLALIAAACGGGGGGGGGNNSSSNNIKQGGTLNYAADQEPTGFNPLTSKDNGTSVLWVVNRVYPSVFHSKPDYTVELDSDLMQSADLTSQDPQTITYKIKPDAAWSDGTPFNADDFVYNWQNQNGSNPKIDAATTAGYKDIKSVTGSDNGKTVTVVFKNKFSDWKSLFGPMVPAHFTKAQKGGWNTGLDKNPQNIPSAGPFKVESYTQGQSLTLSKNAKYWGKPANLDKIVYRFLPESVTQPAALQNNEVDLIYPQPQLDQVQQVQQLPDVQYQINFGLSFEHFDFNFKNPQLADLKVRQAIATGLNRQELLDRTVKQFSSKATVLGNRIWLSGQKQYQDHSGNFGKGDVAAAKQLLEGDGYTLGSDGIYSKGGKKLSFRFSTTAGNQLRETQGVLLQSQMKQIGIDIKIANAPSTKFFGDMLPNGNFDIADFAWVGTPFPVSSSVDIYRTGGGGNYGKYTNPQVDQLFDQATAELDPNKAADLANQIDQILWTDMATIPLYTKPTFLAWRNTFTNITDVATNEGPFVQEPLWAQKA
ncbi:MAG TPA: ABC transporter family substrate-binding protein [Actinomycetes bacterium]